MRFVVVLLVACNSDAPGTLTACPPAPFRFPEAGTRCDFKEECLYRTPVNVGTPFEDTCNGLSCGCCVSSAPWTGCHQPTTANEMVCGSTLIGCTIKVPVCPSDAQDGTPCTQPDAGTRTGNGECLVLGPGADLSQGIVNGQACACDVPGPVWRCVPAATTQPQ